VSADWRNREAFSQPYLTVLFEQKAPARRVPDGTVPKHYIGQVKLGL